MSRDWRRLITLRQQSHSLRECYEDVEAFFDDLSRPAPTAVDELELHQCQRLGYLIAVARLVGGAPMHASWTTLEEQLRTRTADCSDVVALLALDLTANACDDLARSWGLRRGLDSEKVVQIARNGSA